MTEKKEYAKRFGTMLMALLFLVTSVGFSILVIWQVRQDRKNEQEQTRVSQLLEDQNANKLQGTKLASFKPGEEAKSLQIIDIKKGEGDKVKKGASITAHYTGAYAVNGEIFESSKDAGQPASFPLSGVIEGWQKGVPGMAVGGVRRLIIPGKMAYGEAPKGYVPGSTDSPLGTLVFDIELISIN